MNTKRQKVDVFHVSVLDPSCYDPSMLSCFVMVYWWSLHINNTLWPLLFVNYSFSLGLVLGTLQKHTWNYLVNIPKLKTSVSVPPDNPRIAHHHTLLWLNPTAFLHEYNKCKKKKRKKENSFIPRALFHLHTYICTVCMWSVLPNVEEINIQIKNKIKCCHWTCQVCDWAVSKPAHKSA